MSYNLFKFFGMGIAAFFLVVVLNPDFRNEANAMLAPQQRIILAVAHAPLGESTDPLQVLKVKAKDGLYVEVYGQENQGALVMQKLLASAKLPDKRDGYFTFNNQVTNLAIDDIDNDKQREILVTSFDENLVAHLNVYKYIKGQKALSLVKLK